MSGVYRCTCGWQSSVLKLPQTPASIPCGGKCGGVAVYRAPPPPMKRITLELTAEQAAALARFAEKSTWSEAMAVLYGHVRKELREEQASSIIAALAVLERALAAADVRTWPWLESGVAS